MLFPTSPQRQQRDLCWCWGLICYFLRRYAIAFDMDIEQLHVHYGDPYNNAYVEIRRILEELPFQWKQRSVYFGGSAVTAATIMVAVIDLTGRLPWFAALV